MTVVHEALASPIGSRPNDQEEVEPSSSFIMELSDDRVSILSPSLSHSPNLEVGSYLVSERVALVSPLVAELDFPKVEAASNT